MRHAPSLHSFTALGFVLLAACTAGSPSVPDEVGGASAQPPRSGESGAAQPARPADPAVGTPPARPGDPAVAAQPARPGDPAVGTPPAAPADPAVGTQPAALTVPAAAGLTLAAVTASNAFAFDLYHELRGTPGNLAFSPASIALALDMTYAGAAGATASQMAAALHLPADAAAVHAAWATVLHDWSAPASGFELAVANRLFGEQSYGFAPAFVGLTGDRYGAPLDLLAFAAAPEAQRARINGWVKERTHERIAELLPSGSIDAETRLVLANAIWFKAAWSQPFAPSRTEAAPFTLADGSQANAPLMHGELSARYGEVEGAELLELGYDGGRFATLFVLPDAADGLTALEARLDRASLARWSAALEDTRVSVALPRFRVDSGALSLAGPLQALGMRDAFDGRADFSGMSAARARDLRLAAVYHQAFVAMDEAGTEAAAATAVVATRMGAMAAPDRAFRADHPFLFFVRDTTTGLVVFAGRVASPQAPSARS